MAEEILKNIDKRLLNCENILKFLIDKTELYNNIFEINFICKHFSELNNSNIKDKYLKLIENLDENSIKTVQLILNRYQTILSLRRGNIDIYTENEKKILQNIKDNFINCIVHIEPDISAYKNYILPAGHLETNVLFYDCMINEFDNISDLKNRSIIDVGGYIGDSALVLKKYTDAPLYVFEPDDANYAALQKNH